MCCREKAVGRRRRRVSAPAPGGPSRPGPGRRSPHRGAHRDPQQPLPAEGDAPLLHLHQARGPLRPGEVEEGLPPALGHGFPRRPGHRGRRRTRGRRGGPVPGGRAQADPDRRLPGQQGAQHLQHRGGAEGERRRDPHRHLLRPGQGPPGGVDHPDHAHGQGAPLRRGQARSQEHRRFGTAALLPHRRRAPGQDPADRVRRQRGLHRRPAPRGAQEAEALGPDQPELARRQDHVHPRATGDASRTTTSTTAT